MPLPHGSSTRQDHAATLVEFLRAKSKTLEKNRKYMMPLSKLIRLAEVIAAYGKEQKTKIKVPLSVLSSIGEVLNLRKQASRDFMSVSHNDDAFEASNKTHLHIFSILQHVLKSLKPLGYSNPGKYNAQKDTTTTESPSATDPSANVFDALELEETEDNSSSELVTWSGKVNSKGQQSLVSFRIERSDDDFPFAIFCLFKDLNKIRASLRETWQDYRENNTPLVSVAIVTDNAFELIQRREKASFATVDLPANYPKKYVDAPGLQILSSF